MVKRPREDELSMFEVKRQRTLWDDYLMEDVIGEGGQGTVSIVRSKTNNNQIFACKSINITTQDLLLDAQNEADILLHLSKNAGVLSVLQVYENAWEFHIVTELCDCNLEEMISFTGGLEEREAALVIRRLATILEDIHAAGVVHRDIKTSNILCTSSVAPYGIKVADFGLASFQNHWRMYEYTGTPRFMSPEVAGKRFHHKEVDVWGLGVVLYEALTGKYVFSSLSNEKVEEKLGRLEDLPATSLHLSGVSAEAACLILGILHTDPKERLTLEQIKNHPWVTKNIRQQHKQARWIKVEDGTLWETSGGVKAF